MRDDYVPYFQELKRKLSEFGYIGVKEKELSAQFLLVCGWTIKWDCERYSGPAFTISIVPPQGSPGRTEGYAVWLLMQVFQRLTGKNYGKPTIDAQIGFLEAEKDLVFGDPSFYDADYAKLNELTL